MRGIFDHHEIAGFTELLNGHTRPEGKLIKAGLLQVEEIGLMLAGTVKTQNAARLVFICK